MELNDVEKCVIEEGLISIQEVEDKYKEPLSVDWDGELHLYWMIKILINSVKKLQLENNALQNTKDNCPVFNTSGINCSLKESNIDRNKMERAIETCKWLTKDRYHLREEERDSIQTLLNLIENYRVELNEKNNKIITLTSKTKDKINNLRTRVKIIADSYNFIYLEMADFLDEILKEE